jgi:dihydroxyacetone kinase-like protein
VGIYGETCVVRPDALPADEVADAIMGALIEDAGLMGGDHIGLLVNSRGGTPMMELAILNRHACRRVASRDVGGGRTWIRPCCTSLDMRDASASLLKLDNEFRDMLLRPCTGLALRVS